ncbi:MAG: sulfite exporter TauE/SafE family protein [Deltaproteobacteria bacterium]|nr:sulfite exporter TauE/SafE family protein [Deltaproteobacteria bacterium]MCK5710906.1 sulfite exporter TauE/SafE family protein [Deltaproteobacteria bacterium]
MDTHILIIVYTTFFAAAFIKGLTGLGFVTLCLPVIAIFIKLEQAIPLVVLPSLLSNVMVIYQTGRLRQSLRRFWLLYISAFPGIYAGVLILNMAGNYAAKIILGVVSIAYSLLLLLKIELSIPEKNERILSAPIGLTNGFLNGLTGTQIIPMLPYLLSLKLDRDGMINAINVGFTLSITVLLIIFGKFNLISLETLKYSIVGAIPVAVGIYLGGKLRHKISEEKFKLAVLFLLIIIGVNLIVNA